MKKKTWDLYAPIYKRAMKADQQIYDFMYERIPKMVRDKEVLELATGPGLLAKHVAPSARRMVATDYSDPQPDGDRGDDRLPIQSYVIYLHPWRPHQGHGAVLQRGARADRLTGKRLSSRKRSPPSNEKAPRSIFYKAPGLFAKQCLTQRFRLPQPVQIAVLIRDAHCHNLKHIDVTIPKGILTAVTGVAGSGKSPLMRYEFPKRYPDAIVIDQKPIGTSIRSTPATYTGAMDEIRKVFAKANGVGAGWFSFNSEGGCPVCKGAGQIT